MSVGLFTFVFNTLQQRLDDRNNKKLWLPNVLRGIKGSDGKDLLPLHGTDWALGALSGEAGRSLSGQYVTVYQAYFTYLTTKQPDKFSPPVDDDDFEVIRTPDREAALTLPRASITGLENAAVRPGPEVKAHDGGYTAKVTVDFGTYQDGGLPGVVTVSGRFVLVQSLSIAKSGEKTPTTEKHAAPFAWPTFDVPVTGTFELTIADVTAVADTEFAVRGKDVGVTIADIAFAGSKGAPIITIDESKLVVDQNEYTGADPAAWKAIALLALKNPDGQKALLKSVNDTLNLPDNRAKLGGALTDNLTSRLDETLGVGIPGAKSVDDNLFDRLRHAVNDPASKHYLPVALLGIKDPVLDPYQAVLEPFDVDLGGLGQGRLELDNTVVEGIANALAPAAGITFDPGMKAKVTLSALADGTEVTPDGGGPHRLVSPVLVRGVPVLTVDGSELKDPSYWFKATVRGATVDLVLGTSGGDRNRLDTMVVTLESATFAATDVDAQVSFGTEFNKPINEELAKRRAEIRDRIVKAVNDGIAQHKTEIGQSITTRLRELIAAKLDN